MTRNLNTYDWANILDCSSPNAISPGRGFRSRALAGDQASMGTQWATPPFVRKHIS